MNAPCVKNCEATWKLAHAKDKKAAPGHGSEEVTKRHQLFKSPGWDTVEERSPAEEEPGSARGRAPAGGWMRHCAPRERGLVGEGSAALTRSPGPAALTGTASPSVKTRQETEDRPQRPLLARTPLCGLRL